MKKETEGRKGKTDGRPAHTREVKLDACSHRPGGTKKVMPFAIRIPLPILGPSKRPKSLAEASIWKLGTGTGVTRKRSVACRFE